MIVKPSWTLGLVAALCFGFGTLPALAGDAVVTITNLRNGDGNVLLAVCDEANFLKSDCYKQRVKAVPGSVVMTINNIKPGRYAIQLIHDENQNGDIDLNFLGIPTEGYAFSNGGKPLFAEPVFADCAVEIGTAPLVITITMRYFSL